MKTSFVVPETIADTWRHLAEQDQLPFFASQIVLERCTGTAGPCCIMTANPKLPKKNQRHAALFLLGWLTACCQHTDQSFSPTGKDI